MLVLTLWAGVSANPSQGAFRGSWRVLHCPCPLSPRESPLTWGKAFCWQLPSPVALSAGKPTSCPLSVEAHHPADSPVDRT